MENQIMRCLFATDRRSDNGDIITMMKKSFHDRSHDLQLAAHPLGHCADKDKKKEDVDVVLVDFPLGQEGALDTLVTIHDLYPGAEVWCMVPLGASGELVDRIEALSNTHHVRLSDDSQVRKTNFTAFAKDRAIRLCRALEAVGS
jgi:hypothetical protein